MPAFAAIDDVNEVAAPPGVDEAVPTPAGAHTSSAFEPILIVGAGRSGTTMLAVLFDRHSRIAVPPETRFFSEYVPEMWPEGGEGSREEKVDRAMRHEATGALGLDRGELLAHFRHYPNTFPNLFRAMIELYAINQGKTRPGEKTPRHLEHIPLLFREFPKAKAICIVRDGRDVVASAMRTNWYKGEHRRFYKFCADWNNSARLALQCAARYGPDRFTIIRYFEVLKEPEQAMRRLCAFVGEEFEPSQIDPSKATGVVLDNAVDLELKAKARAELDPSRVQAWRREVRQRDVWAMNAMMGRMLRRMGYEETSIAGCPLSFRMWLMIMRVLYSRPVKPVVTALWQVLRLSRRRVK